MYQFIHVETYSLTASKKKIKFNDETKGPGRNVSDIINEVKRKPGFCEHVEAPEEPKVLYGVTPDEVENLAKNYFKNTKLKDSLGRSRALRKDANVLLAGVISLSNELVDIWEDYKKDAIKYLKEKYGDRLVSVVEHTDEDHPHLHFYCIQEENKSFDLLHDGKKAFNADSKLPRYKKEIAFKSAMRDFQEDFYSKVSTKHGLLKTGPKRARLTNEEYKA
ncbi:TPA: plasmid recombination protein, partial [Providencia rettgeri]|nr:plasmid recombination protein [Providencia rettgeri]HEM8270841.1 plasmid recombination protein [Providencia rettgeri]